MPGTAAPPAGAAAAPPPAETGPPAPEPVRLRDFETQDRSARGKVPDEEGWVTGGVNGAIECFHPTRGELHLGIPAVVPMPGGMTAMMAPSYGWVVAPYMQALPAVSHVWPQLRNMLEPGVGFGYIHVESAHPQSWGAPFDVGMFQIRFQRGSEEWHGAILAATAPIPNDDRWLFYYSQMGVPATDDGSVYKALCEAWKAYDSSKAQANRTAAALQAQKDAGALLDKMYLARQDALSRALTNWSTQWRS